MRTTLDLDEELLRKAGEAADEDGITLAALLDAALRQALSQRAKPNGDRPYIDLPVFRSPGPFVLPEGVTAERIGHIFDDLR